MKFIIIFLLFIQTLFGEVFQPNGSHCSEYQYLNQRLTSGDYVATAMKANENITITSVTVGGIATADSPTIQDAKFKVELVEDGGKYEPTGKVLATLGEISDNDLVGTFTFSNLSINIPSGQIIYLKYTPIIPISSEKNYFFIAKECWCDATNCNEEGNLQLGSHLNAQPSARVSQIWRTSSSSNQLGVYTNTHFANLSITYDKFIDLNLSATKPFTCNNEGLIFNFELPTSEETTVSILDIENQKFNFLKNFSARHINAIGYNVQDNFLYGIGHSNSFYKTIDVLKIDKEYNIEKLEVTGLPQGNSLYALGDVDFNNTLYVSSIVDENLSDYSTYLHNLILIDLKTQNVKSTIPLIFPKLATMPREVQNIYEIDGMSNIMAADYAFNPKDSMLYTIDNRSNQLVRINPISGQVELLGDIGNVGDAYSVISFFDIEGNFLFSNGDNTSLYKIDISNPSKINPIATPYIGNLTMPSSGDGAKCAYSRLPYKPFLGTFNIERTNSINQTINSTERNAWYTQIVGRDFHYSVVAYDESISSTQEIQNLTFKVTLYDNETNSTVSEMTPYYGHFSTLNPTHRITIGNPNDLNQLSAYKNVVFQISYAVDTNDSLIQAPCPLGDFETCFNNLASINIIKTVSAKDNFAIRPKAFLVNIEDNGTERINNDIPHSIRLATGYNYQLNISAVDNNFNNIHIYKNNNVNQALIFMGNKINCQNSDDNNKTISFNNGINIDNNFTHDEVGIYLLNIKDTQWTQEDSKNNKGDCLINSSLISENGNELSGCNIIEKNALTLDFYPHHFDLNISINGLPNSGHNEFLYMSEINASYQDFALQFIGTITAESKNNIRTKNFTTGCASENIELILESNITSDTGINTALLTTPNSQGIRTPIAFKRIINYNKSTFTDEGNLTTTSFPLTISQNRFLDNNRGSLHLDVRYNINKNITQAINPIAIHYSGLKVYSRNASSTAEQIVSYIPKGLQSTEATLFFYYARVVPDAYLYPRVRFIGKPIEINTALSVEIFCLNSSTNFCQNMKIPEYSNLYSSPNIQMGWYLSSHHNPILDGQITQLKPLDKSSNTFGNSDGDSLVQAQATTVSPNSNILLPNGKNNNIQTTIRTATNKLNTISIVLPPQLKYDRDPRLNGNPQYAIPLSLASKEWSGIGETGHIIQATIQTKSSGKAEW